MDQSILQRMLAATMGPAPPTPPPVSAPLPQFYPHNGNIYGGGPSSHMPPFPPNMAPPMFPPPGPMPPPNFYRPTPPPVMAPPTQVQHPPGGSSTPVLQQPSPVQANMYQRAPLPAQANANAALSNISESHKVETFLRFENCISNFITGFIKTSCEYVG